MYFPLPLVLVIAGVPEKSNQKHLNEYHGKAINTI
jgi:hypothetical protein